MRSYVYYKKNNNNNNNNNNKQTENREKKLHNITTYLALKTKNNKHPISK